MCQDSPSHTTGIWEVPPLNSSCSYLGSQWHRSWTVDAEIPCFMYLWTFPSQVAPTLYWGCQIRMRTNQDRSELGGSHYLSCLWKHKVRKTWMVSGFWWWWLIQTQIFESFFFFFPVCEKFENWQYVPPQNNSDEWVSENCIRKAQLQNLKTKHYGWIFIFHY